MDKKGIYCIENTKNGKKYIGSSKELRKRKSRHFSELKNNKHKNQKLQNGYNKYGKEFFVFYVIEEVNDEKTLIEREQYYLDNLKPFYNINIIANSSLGIKRSKKTKEKVRQANLGLKHPEWRNKIKSEAQGGKNHWTTKKSFKKKSKKKMSKTHKKLYKNGYKSPVAKMVLELDNNGYVINQWSSLSKAGEHYNVTYQTISNLIEKKVKTSISLKNKIFKYAE